MAAVQIRLEQEKVTKNTVRYREIPADPKAPEELVIDSLYVQKRALRQLDGGDFPTQLQLTIETV